MCQRCDVLAVLTLFRSRLCWPELFEFRKVKRSAMPQLHLGTFLDFRCSLPGARKFLPLAESVICVEGAKIAKTWLPPRTPKWRRRRPAVGQHTIVAHSATATHSSIRHSRRFAYTCMHKASVCVTGRHDSAYWYFELVVGYHADQW